MARAAEAKDISEVEDEEPIKASPDIHGDVETAETASPIDAEVVTPLRRPGSISPDQDVEQAPVFSHASAADGSSDAPAPADDLETVEDAIVSDIQEVLEPDGSDDEGDDVPVEGLLEEDQLREIVADVVREELAGHLGERITRNVRKLVRREIRQVLATQKFED